MEKVRKHSKKRDAIWQCLSETRSHPSALWIYDQVKVNVHDLSLGTVYRNLAMFKEEGSIISVGVVDGLERYDACTTPHVHFICDTCNEVMDVKDLGMPNSLIQQASTSIGGDIAGYNLTFYGVCQNCCE